MRISFTIVFAALLLGGCPGPSGPVETPDPDVLLLFHNGAGPLCRQAADWLAEMRTTYPDLVTQEHLVYEEGEMGLLRQLEALYGESQGLSTKFVYLPVAFYQGQAFSGFSNEIAESLESLIVAAEAAP